MRVYYVSDIHNDYHRENALLALKGDEDAVLVVAGDINSKGQSVRDLEAVADRWKAVVAVAGNHDWWGLALHEKHKFESDLDNVHILLNDTIKIGDVVFCGTTLWHPVGDWFDEQVWRKTMNDAKKIRGYNYRKLSREDINTMFHDNVRFIEDCRGVYKDFKKVLITHHALSDKSLDPRFRGCSSETYYSCNMPDLLEGFLYHIHGHIHCESDYIQNGCNVVCNPLGYGEDNYDYGLRILDV